MLQRMFISTVFLLMLFSFSIEGQALTIQLFDYEMGSDGEGWYASSIIGADYVWTPDTWIDLVIDTPGYTITAWRDEGTPLDYDDDTDVTNEITFDTPYVGGSMHYIWIEYSQLSGSGNLDITVTDGFDSAWKTLKIGAIKTIDIPPGPPVTTQIKDVNAWLLSYANGTSTDVSGDSSFTWSDDEELDIAFGFKQDTTDQPIDLTEKFDGVDGSYWSIIATQGGTDITSLLEFSCPYRWKSTIDAATDIQVYTQETIVQHWIYVGYDDSVVMSNDPITFTITLTDWNSYETTRTLTVNLN